MKKDSRTYNCLIDNAINYLEIAKKSNHKKDLIKEVKNAINQLDLLIKDIK